MTKQQDPSVRAQYLRLKQRMGLAPMTEAEIAELRDLEAEGHVYGSRLGIDDPREPSA